MGDSGEDNTIQRRWKTHVDTRLTKIDLALADNTVITTQLVSSLAEHQRRTAPVIEAIENMQAGVRVLGSIGNGVAWTARTSWRALRVAAPVAGALAAVYAALHEYLDPIIHGLMWWKK